MFSNFFRILFLLIPVLGIAQGKITQDYYLPKIQYDPAVPTPKAFLGYEVGEWHTSHDKLVEYMRALAASSNRIVFKEYGRSHENRPLICLTISDPANLNRLEEIKEQRRHLIDPQWKAPIDIQNMPAVEYMGHSIHGNETSGSNAAILMAYYLAAGKSPEIEKLLKNTIILFDPCFNPDGMQRFSSWINSHKAINGSPDPLGDEYNEPWPKGRTNHYGFDLNRDWLVAQQPESVGRVAVFQEWHPNVLTDHHEMGSNSTFFFQPGVPARVNPITPKKNQELTAAIGKYHAKRLQENNVLFFTGESYDDFYYGKGSTYPDVQGSIGILFEQASSRGTAQETENGLLTFPYSIRNQVSTALSTLEAVGDMRVELNQYLHDFYVSALEEGGKSAIKGYVFADGDLPAREFLSLLGKHSVKAQALKENVTIDGVQYSAGGAFFVPCEQPQYRLVRAVFERTTTFADSIFYDISAWTLPDAFGLQWSAVTAKNFNARNYDAGLSMVSLNPPYRLDDKLRYGYAIDPYPYETPKYLWELLRAGVRVRVAMEPFTSGGQEIPIGALIVDADRQPIGEKALLSIMDNLASEGVHMSVLENGITESGPDLGSSQFAVVKSPKAVMITGEGVNIAEAGEIWHLLDTRYGMPLALVDMQRATGITAAKYNVMILPDGAFHTAMVEVVRKFVQEGGTVIATGRSLNWLKNATLVPVDFRKSAYLPEKKRPYANIVEDKGALAKPGAIFEAVLDLTHPLCFGYKNSQIPMFYGDSDFISPGKNPYSTPIALTENPLLAGYLHPSEKAIAGGAAAAIVYGVGRGKIIGFPGDLNFRAFWYGTNRIFANALFFGSLISGEGVERN